MTLLRRLHRLEAIAWLRGPTTPDTSMEWTADMRVQALRNILAAVFGSRGNDPFPELEGEAYLLQFGDWYIANVEGWPKWAQGAAFRIGNIVEALRRRMSPADFRKLVRANKGESR